MTPFKRQYSRRLLSCTALAAALLVSACGGGGDDTPSPNPTPVDQLEAVTVAGYPHAVNVYRTAGATRAIVLLHGGGGDLNAVAYQVGLNNSVTTTTSSSINWSWLDANRVMLVVPQGQHIAGNDGATTWNNHAMISGQDDKAFLQSLAAKIRSDYGISTITLMGHSMGGVMTNRMWCESPSTFNSYVSLAGPASSYYSDAATPCNPGAAARPYMGIIGDSDSIMQTSGAWDAAAWGINPAVVLASQAAWVNRIVISEFRQQQARTSIVCNGTLDPAAFTTVGNVDTWNSCNSKLSLKRVRGADHGVSSIDEQMGTASKLDVMNAVMGFASSQL